MKIEPAVKNSCVEAIKNRLLRERFIAFAYIHGSFTSKNGFNDIDVAIYLADRPGSILEVELDLEGALEATLVSCGIKAPVDVRVLNAAPLAFRYRASKDAILLFSRDNRTRVNFEAITRSLYFDYLPLRDKYLAGVFGRAV